MNPMLIIFEGHGREIERQVARDCERACQIASLLIAELGWLEVGDTLTIEED
jgi:hypothetical protein